MASQRSIEVKVGALILVALGLLAAFIFVMGSINFEPTYSIFVDFDNPGGLQTGAPVKIAGVKIGRIAEIQFRGGQQNAATGQREALVRVRASLEKRYQRAIHQNGTFYVTTQGVLGEQFLQIDPGSSDRPMLPENAVVRGLDPPRLDMLLAESYELLHAGVSAIRENKQQLTETFEGLRDTLKGTGEFMRNNRERLDRIAQNVEAISQESRDLVRAARSRYVDSAEIHRIIANIDRATALVSRDLDPLMKDARETMANANRLSATLGAAEQQGKIKSTLADAAEIASRGKAAIADAQAIVAHIKKGQGSVGALVMDEQIYDDLQEMLRDLKHNPWKFFWRE